MASAVRFHSRFDAGEWWVVEVWMSADGDVVHDVLPRPAWLHPDDPRGSFSVLSGAHGMDGGEMRTYHRKEYAVPVGDSALYPSYTLRERLLEHVIRLLKAARIRTGEGSGSGA